MNCIRRANGRVHARGRDRAIGTTRETSGLLVDTEANGERRIADGVERCRVVISVF